jgi:predicted nuclease of restriction endonuclease-like (RecB) superfamily
MEISEDLLFQSVKEIIIKSSEKVFRIANSTLLLAYWQIRKLIVEDEQKGKERAEYGKYTLKNLSKKLTLEFGKGFDYTNLSNMRKFYTVFPIVDALRQQLSWTHYRLLIKLDNAEKINYYTNEAIQNNWNAGNLISKQIFNLSS